MHKLSFAILGVLGIAGFFMWDRTTDAEQAQPEGSVAISGALESTHLLAGGSDVFALISMTGAKAPTAQKRMPISLTLIVDTSGSMFGEKMDSARLAAGHALDQLQPGDRVSVIAFSSAAQVVVDALEIGKEDADIMGAKEAVRGLKAMGGTDMLAALQVAERQSRKIYTDGRVNRVMLMSDGHPDTEAGLLQAVQVLARAGVTTTTLGLGIDYNEDLMSDLADKGYGNYYFIEKAEEMQNIFSAELKSMASVVGQNAVVSIKAMKDVRIEKIYGYEASTGAEMTAIPVGDIYGGQTSDILVRLHVPSSFRMGKTALLSVTTTYHDALAEKDIKHTQLLSAEIVGDHDLVLANAQPLVLEKAERVRTAQAMEDAGVALADGKLNKAKEIFARQQENIGTLTMKLGGLRGKKGHAIVTKKAKQMQKDFAAMVGTAKRAPTKVYEKKAKAAARSYRR